MTSANRAACRPTRRRFVVNFLAARRRAVFSSRDFPTVPGLMTALPNPFDRDRRKFHASLNNLFYFNPVAVIDEGVSRVCVKISDTPLGIRRTPGAMARPRHRAPRNKSGRLACEGELSAACVGRGESTCAVDQAVSSSGGIEKQEKEGPASSPKRGRVIRPLTDKRTRTLFAIFPTKW